MTNEENINNIVSEVVIFGNEVSVDALKYALSLLARRKDQQFKDIITQVRKWLDEQCKLDQLDLVEFDMRIEECWEGRK